ncbi:hypothetical protein [Helicovermis profundi]|uniref:Uncharacterized protein n=1 Tax=Helicovermis profundi TaxID=3065157 RepID=A0AAU9E3N3_9FIRM|nr:hypothetical protein HLPR_14870 [Clostridia bacterium S502]
MEYFRLIAGIIFLVMTYYILENKLSFLKKLKKKPYLRMVVLFIYMYLGVTFLKNI